MERLFISLSADKINQKEELAAAAGDVAEMRHIGQELERATRILNSWAIVNNSEMISQIGSILRLAIPVDALSELQHKIEEIESALDSPVSIGVGLNVLEADKALQATIKQGGDGVTFYTEDTEKVLENVDEEDKEDGLADIAALNKTAKHLPFEEHIKAKEQAQAEQEQSQQNEASAKQVKTKIIQLLQGLKEQSKEVEKLKEADPQLYQTINEMVQGIVLMAKELAKQSPEQMAKAVGAIRAKHNVMQYPVNFLLPPGPGTHNGRGGKLKVLHNNGRTTWISVRAGMIMSPEGKPTSSRNPSGYKERDENEQEGTE